MNALYGGDDPVFICICNAVTDGDIERAAARGACALRDLRRELGVASGCGRCAGAARACLQRARAAERSATAQTPPGGARTGELYSAVRSRAGGVS